MPHPDSEVGFYIMLCMLLPHKDNEVQDLAHVTEVTIFNHDAKVSQFGKRFVYFPECLTLFALHLGTSSECVSACEGVCACVCVCVCVCICACL